MASSKNLASSSSIPSPPPPSAPKTLPVSTSSVPPNPTPTFPRSFAEVAAQPPVLPLSNLKFCPGVPKPSLPHPPSFSSFFNQLFLNHQCFRCFGKGHLLASCRDPLRCYRCLGVGHKGSACPSFSFRTGVSVPPPTSSSSVVCHPVLTSTPNLTNVSSSTGHAVTAPPVGHLSPSPTLPSTPPPILPIEDDVHVFISPSDDGYANHFALLKAALVEVSSGTTSEAFVINLLRSEFGGKFRFIVRCHSRGNFLVFFRHGNSFQMHAGFSISERRSS